MLLRIALARTGGTGEDALIDGLACSYRTTGRESVLRPDPHDESTRGGQGPRSPRATGCQLPSRSGARHARGAECGLTGPTACASVHRAREP
jgi:hypothetical protein